MAYCKLKYVRWRADFLLATTAIVRSTVCNLVFTDSVTGPKESRLTCGQYSICAVCRLYFGFYSKCNSLRGRSDRLFATIVIVRCTVLNVGLTVSITGPKGKQAKMLDKIAILRYTISNLGLPFIAKGPDRCQNVCWSL